MVRRDVLAGEGSRRDHPTGKLDAGMGVDGNQNPSECERDAERRRRYGLTPVPELTGHTRVFSYYLGVLFSTGWTRESTKAFENALVAGNVNPPDAHRTDTFSLGTDRSGRESRPNLTARPSLDGCLCTPLALHPDRLKSRSRRVREVGH